MVWPRATDLPHEVYGMMATVIHGARETGLGRVRYQPLKLVCAADVPVQDLEHDFRPQLAALQKRRLDTRMFTLDTLLHICGFLGLGLGGLMSVTPTTGSCTALRYQGGHSSSSPRLPDPARCGSPLRVLAALVLDGGTHPALSLPSRRITRSAALASSHDRTARQDMATPANTTYLAPIIVAVD
jgi:hypothetical protein